MQHFKAIILKFLKKIRIVGERSRVYCTSTDHRNPQKRVLQIIKNGP